MQTLDNLPVPPSRRGQVIVYALERWQSMTLVLVACLGIAATVAFLDASLLLLVVFVAFGVLGVGAMVLISFRDDASLDEALLSKADLGELRDKLLREKVARAEAYQLAIRQAVRAARAPAVRASLEVITRELADPVALVFSLAKRLDEYQANQLIQQDLRRLSAGRPLNEAERAQLESLQKLQRLMGETAQAIDSALAQLGSSYTAIQLAQSSSELRGTSASSVRAELRQQSEQLRDLNTSLDEVYAERLRGGI
ncbi:MAG: hypothetical protein M1401_07385 [Chloroflexi bacterium]|nr:hypothetical protein [Chloroflexota bacterium]